MKVLSVLNHDMTANQKSGLGTISNIQDLGFRWAESLKNCPQERYKLDALANKLAKVAIKYDVVILPVGSPAFMFLFAQKIAKMRIDGIETEFWFAHSERKSVETITDGTVTKKSIFEFRGWIKC